MRTVKQVPLAELPATACLARDVLDAKGRRLLAAGSVLTDAARELLQRRDIGAVFVEVLETSTPEQLHRETERIRAAVARRFRDSDDNPGLVKLRELILEYRLKALE